MRTFTAVLYKTVKF